MPEIIDLSQEIYDGMPVYKGLPQVKIGIHATHEAVSYTHLSDIYQVI